MWAWAVRSLLALLRSEAPAAKSGYLCKTWLALAINMFDANLIAEFARPYWARGLKNDYFQ
jgi:hypothetical protein